MKITLPLADGIVVHLETEKYAFYSKRESYCHV